MTNQAKSQRNGFGRPAYRSQYRSPNDSIDHQRVGTHVAPPRFLLTEELAAGKTLFASDLERYVAHPHVAPLAADGSESKRQIEFLLLSAFNQMTEQLEHEMVNRVLLDIKYDTLGLSLPRELRRDAGIIYEEEANHARVAEDLTDQITRATGLVPPQFPRPAYFERVSALEAILGPPLDRLVKPLLVVATETCITGVLAKVPKDDRVLSVVREVIDDHARDEAKHSAYFTAVFTELWPRLPVEHRASLGPLLPNIVQAFLSPDRRTIQAQLAVLGLSRDKQREVLFEAYPEADVQRDIARSAAGTVALFRRFGVLDDPQSLEAFGEAGLLT